MWQPDPAWQPMPGGRGTLTDGMWRIPAAGDAGEQVVKRIRRPDTDDHPSLSEPAHPAYWRRELELATSTLPLSGVRRPRVRAVDEDEDGYVLVTDFVHGDPPTGPFAAAALGALTTSEWDEQPWLARQTLRRRLERTEERDGWPTLARTTVADLAHELWRRRGSFLARYDDLPQRPSHGDAVPANLLASPEGPVALDWSACGLAPAGADLGYFALASREDFDVLLGAFCTRVGDVRRDDIAFAARLMAVYTVVSQAEWALARAAAAPGALAAKYRHPSVAPYLRALQRQFPQIEALLA